MNLVRSRTVRGATVQRRLAQNQRSTGGGEPFEGAGGQMSTTLGSI